MKLSVIVPVYNLENYIEQCIDSILVQTYSDFELLIIDDGSTDRSLSIINDYSKNDNRIRVITKENEGISLTRNRGIQEASGDYLYFVDGDDWIHKETLKSHMNLVEQVPNCDLVLGRMSMFFDGETKLKEDEFIVENEVVANKSGKNAFVAIIDEIGFIRLGVRGLFKRKFLLKHKLFFKPHMYSEDVEWMMSCILSAEICASNDNAYYHYRARRPGSLVNTPSIKKSLDVLNIYQTWICIADAEEDSIFKQYFYNEISERFINTFIEFSSQFVPAKIDMNLFHSKVNQEKNIIKKSKRKKTLLKGLPLLIMGSKLTSKLYYYIKKWKNRNSQPSYF
ncbi:glycosyltransferase family 2 protein [Marinilactibacillus psychrotolerans]|uniref:glycosyltransferase family 2 protein n=1 Tax=Marinilactibacillus psychrotolerans TaxID=191770 RepID=UPI00388510FD